MTKAKNLRWVVVESEGPQVESAPEWSRSAAMDNDSVVWVPAVLAGDELLVTLTIGWAADAEIVQAHGHAYIPVCILAREFPKHADFFAGVEEKVRCHFLGKAAEKPARNRHRCGS